MPTVGDYFKLVSDAGCWIEWDGEAGGELRLVAGKESNLDGACRAFDLWGEMASSVRDEVERESGRRDSRDVGGLVRWLDQCGMAPWVSSNVQHVIVKDRGVCTRDQRSANHALIARQEKELVEWLGEHMPERRFEASAGKSETTSEKRSRSLHGAALSGSGMLAIAE